jgi:hypothetical protein
MRRRHPSRLACAVTTALALTAAPSATAAAPLEDERNYEPAPHPRPFDLAG